MQSTLWLSRVEKVFAPVTVEITPHAVNVIGVVLRVVVLDQKRGALHTVIVAFAFLQAAHPSEFDLIEAGMADFVQPLARLCARLRTQIFLDPSAPGSSPSSGSMTSPSASATQA
jgi:hypothetical protein